MKKLVFKLSLFGLAMLLVTPACNKDEDGALQFTHRIVSEKEYYNNQVDYETTYEYTNNKLTAIREVGDDAYTILISYPDANTIAATGADFGTATLKLTNNLVTEVLMGTDEKTLLSYNSDGLVTSVKEYEFDVSWILEYESTYTYSSGKLVLISEIEYGSEGNYEDKYTFSYNGAEINEQIGSYKDGNTWIDDYKMVYLYTNGKITKITYYYKNSTTWAEDGYEEFTYDSFGNLTASIWGGETAYRTEYIYEKGNGNFRQIFGAVDFEYGYPIPNKKSQTTERNSFDIRSILNLR